MNKMKWICDLILLVCCLSVTSSLFSSLKDNLISNFNPKLRSNTVREADKSYDDNLDETFHGLDIEKDQNWPKIFQYGEHSHFAEAYHPNNVKEHRLDKNDEEVAKNRLQYMKMVKRQEESREGKDEPLTTTVSDIEKKYFKIDPVLNMLRSGSFRRRNKDSSDSGTSSSSRELKNWKEEFRESWLHKKFEALNSSVPSGDMVNLVAARPWGVPCGDPNQHDMPWGSCTLAMECEPEYRIYRGDTFCGRTRFVCCALKLNDYDMYQGFDISLDEKSMSTDSDEKRDKGKSSKERRKRKQERDRKKRRRGREARKKKIRRNIQRIIKEIKKILNKQYKNGTKERKKRTKQLKKFLKDLKKQYRKDRESVKNLHEKDTLIIDKKLMTKLNQIKLMNQNFVNNRTFRDVVVNGTMTKKSARMLLEAYPELAEYMTSSGRRAGGGDEATLEYDVEYGYLYY